MFWAACSRRRERLVTLLLCLSLSALLNVVFLLWPGSVYSLSSITNGLGERESISARRIYYTGGICTNCSDKLGDLYVSDRANVPLSHDSSELYRAVQVERDSGFDGVKQVQYIPVDLHKAPQRSVSGSNLDNTVSTATTWNSVTTSTVFNDGMTQDGSERLRGELLMREDPVIRAERSLKWERGGEKDTTQNNDTRVRMQVHENSLKRLSLDAELETVSLYKDEGRYETREGAETSKLAVGRTAEMNSEPKSQAELDREAVNSMKRLLNKLELSDNRTKNKRVMLNGAELQDPVDDGRRLGTGPGTTAKGHSVHGSYLISVDYDQQMMGFFRAFYHLSLFATAFNLSIVEPHIYGKGRYGIPVLRTDRRPTFLKMTNFYDRTQLKCALRSCAKSNLVSFYDFAQSSSPDVILLSFLTSLQGYEQYFSYKEKVVEIGVITEKLNQSMSALNAWTSFISSRRGLEPITFRSVRIVLIDARPRYTLSLGEIKEKLDPIIQEQVKRFGAATIVIDNWRDIGFHSQYFYSIRGFDNMGCKDMFATGHSRAVVNAARNFSKSLNLTSPVVGVHIRGERLLIESKDSPSYYMHCLRQLKNLLEDGSIEGLSRNSVVLFHDLGKYGSLSCHHYQGCLEHKSKFLWHIENFGYRVASFDPTPFMPVLLRSVYAAFVEKEYLSHVDILVTVGLGNYQQNIVDRFLNHTGGVGDKLHRLCFSPHHHRHSQHTHKIYAAPHS